MSVYMTFGNILLTVNLCIIVLWSIAFVPVVLLWKRVWLLVLTTFILIIFELILAWEIYDFPFNMLRVLFMVFMSVSGIYWVNNPSSDLRNDQKLTDLLSEKKVVSRM